MKYLFLYFLLVLAVLGCSLNMTKTYVEGENDQVIQEASQKADNDVKVKAKIPIKVIP